MRVFGVFLSLNGLLFILCEREKFYYFLFPIHYILIFRGCKSYQSMRRFLTHKKTDALAFHHFEGIQTFSWRNALGDCARLAARPLKRHVLKHCASWRETCLASAFALRLANQRARASTLHTRSKETILSESRDVAKRKKDSRCCPHSVL